MPGNWRPALTLLGAAALLVPVAGCTQEPGCADYAALGPSGAHEQQDTGRIIAFVKPALTVDRPAVELALKSAAARHLGGSPNTTWVFTGARRLPDLLCPEGLVHRLELDRSRAARAPAAAPAPSRNAAQEVEYLEAQGTTRTLSAEELQRLQEAYLATGNMEGVRRTTRHLLGMP